MLRFAASALLALLVLDSTTAAPEHVQLMIRRGDIKVRGVNLGSWLVGEHWMSYTSPAWAGLDKSIAQLGEWKAMEKLGHAVGDKQFDDHRRTWITKADIAEIASYGLNTVRVPVGYWIVNGDASTVKTETSKVYAPEVGSSVRTGLSYLDELINDWAVAYNVSVMLSLHAHQGSQNGYDHSAPQVFGEKHWTDSEENYQSSLQFSTVLAARYKNAPAFLGMNLMNEPNYGGDDTPTAKVHKYFEEAYAIIRRTGNDCILAVSPSISQQAPPFMMDYMRPPTFTNVWNEFHPYYIWGFENQNEEFLIRAASGYADGFLKPSAWKGNPTLLGEWCMDGPDSAPFNDKVKLREFAQAQLTSYENAGAGWTFWSWRHDDETSTSSGWSMRQLLRQGDLVLPWQKKTPAFTIPTSPIHCA